MLGVFGVVICVEKVKQKKINYFMTDEEAAIMWNASKKYPKLHIMIGFALFRGMRIGEICAINIYDFQNSGFQKLNIVLEKSHIQDEFPLLKEFSELLKEYVTKNMHTFKNGYMFPYYSSTRKQHMSMESAGAFMSKLRKSLGKEHSCFLERQIVKTKKGEQYRYRISWHSCRRWFETRIWENYKDKMMLRDLMRYKDSKTVDVYINPYETWKKEMDILNSTFGGLFDNFNNVSKGQTKLNSYI